MCVCVYIYTVDRYEYPCIILKVELCGVDLSPLFGGTWCDASLYMTKHKDSKKYIHKTYFNVMVIK